MNKPLCKMQFGIFFFLLPSIRTELKYIKEEKNTFVRNANVTTNRKKARLKKNDNDQGGKKEENTLSTKKKED